MKKLKEKTNNNVTVTFQSQTLNHIRRKPSHYNHKYEKIHHKTTMIHSSTTVLLILLFWSKGISFNSSPADT